MESDAVFERMSCGRALCGTYVCGRSELIGSKRASKQLLRSPKICESLEPDQPYRMESMFSSSIQAGEKFRELLSNSGWSVALSATAAFYGCGRVTVSGGGGRDRAKEMTSSSDVLTSEAFHMQYWYIPKASFSIPRNQMLLSEDALADMRLIHTIEGAETFLSHYNSHVSSGRYHVGGVLLKGVTIKSNSESTLESLLDKVSSKANAEASYEKVKSGVKVVNVDSKNTYSTSKQSSTGEQYFTNSQQAIVTCVHIALGPQTDDEVKFRTELNDKSTWHIIDTSDTAELIPVWEIASMESSGGLREACDLLREAWQRSVESSVACRTGRVYELWRQSEQQARTLKVTALLTELRISPSSETRLDIQLSDLWHAVSDRVKSDDSVPTSDKLRLFRDPEFRLLLDRIVKSIDGAAKTFLRRIIDSDMQKLLEEQNVVLSSSVSTFIQNEAQNKSITDMLRPLGESPTPGLLDHAWPRLGEKDKAATPALQEEISLDNIDVVRYSSYNKNYCLYTYRGDYLVDRHVAESSKDPYKGMMDRMKHRQDPFATTGISITKDDDEKSGKDDDDFFGSDAKSVDITPNTNTNCQFKTLMQLLRRSDVLVQIALLQLLLEERFAVPLVIPRAEDSHDFCHLTEALIFTRVKLANQEIMKPSIAENTSLPRVVFVSNRAVVSQRESAYMACEVMNCRFPSVFVKNESGADFAILELGVGFLENAKEKPLEHVPCLAFHVWGDHNKLGTILEKVADIVIIEMDPKMQPSMPSWNSSRQCATRFWSISSKGKGGDRDSSHMWGNFKEITTGINQYVLNMIKPQKSEGGAMTLINCVSSLSPLNGKKVTSNIEQLDSIQFDRASLPLQNIYTEEAKFFFESLEKRGKGQEFHGRMEECKERRRGLANDIYRLPILQSFVHCFEETDLVKRSLNFWHLQLIIDRKSQQMLNKVKDPVAKTLHKAANSIVHGYAKTEYVDQMFGLEHLWRELSHIFVAHPILHRRLPTFAAYHLLDGFPLEILDGDATYFHKSWVKAVLSRLDSELDALLGHKPKVFVLSVIGLQSSGKSTLLNIMFGTKLKTSAGQCTRGVFLQLVKSEWSEFDYVLILDTMGMRSPEFFGLRDKDAQDNRLAAFAILPADACIIMVTNEDDNGLKEILPMVMLAFKGSSVAEKYSRKMQAKIFFVYRSVDLNDVHKFAKNQRKLQEELRSASSAIANLNIDETSESVSVSECDNKSLLSSFVINIEDEKQSDVKYFGNHKKGTYPPGDVPDFDYGSKVEELRYYIHERVLDKGRWSAQELMDWNSFLETVWDSISESDFELSFLNHIEHSNYQDMQKRLATCRQKVGKTWQDQFELLTRKHEADEQVSSSKFLWTRLKIQVDPIVMEEDKEVLHILSLKHHQKWKIPETKRWEADRLDGERYWSNQLEGFFDGVLKFDLIVKDYMNELQQEMSCTSKNHSDIDSDDRKREMKEDFESIFERILHKAADKHPAMAMQVKEQIHKIYEEDPVLSWKIDFNEKSTNNNQFFTGLKNAANAALKNVSGLLGSDAKAHELEFQTLISRVHFCLEGVKQYSDHFVREMIQVTDALSTRARKSKHVQALMHKLVKQLLEKEFQRIQERWDSNHNVSKRLETQRDYLWLFFQNLANRVDGTNMLSMAFCCNMLQQQQLMGAYEERIAKVVSDKIRSEKWLSDGKVMRAHLDLHLIDLIEKKNFEDLLACVSDGAWHHRIVLDRFIEREIMKQDANDNNKTQLKGAIHEAVKNAVVEAERPTAVPRPKLLVFRRSIVKSLSHISGELSRLISINVSEKMCEQYGNDIDFGKICDDVSKKIRDISIQLSSSNIRKVVHMVRARLIDSRLDTARTRCDEMCPRCGVTCMNAANHSGEHDSLHQPQGLCGIGVESRRSSNKYIQRILNPFGGKRLELSWPSCVKCIELNYYMEVSGSPNEIDSYQNWTNHFPTWERPSYDLGRTVQLREYIFATYQRKLLDKYNSLENVKLEACRDIPTQYSKLKLGELRRELELVTLIG